VKSYLLTVTLVTGLPCAKRRFSGNAGKVVQGPHVRDVAPDHLKGRDRMSESKEVSPCAPAGAADLEWSHTWCHACCCLRGWPHLYGSGHKPVYLDGCRFCEASANLSLLAILQSTKQQ
jgi:hypothetical protein